MNIMLDIMLNCFPAVTSSRPGTPEAHAFRDAAQNSAATKQYQKTYDNKVVFHSHQPGDLVLLDEPAQRMNKLGPG